MVEAQKKSMIRAVPSKKTPSPTGNAGRKALGRGLSALLSPTSVEVSLRNVPSSEYDLAKEQVDPKSLDSNTTDNHAEPVTQLQVVALDQIQPDPNQPRKHFSEEDLSELASSIRENGLLQPVIVRHIPPNSEDAAQYQIVAGERRWRAARLADLKKIPILVRELTDRECLEIGIVENVQRADLNPIEEALAYRRLVEDFGETHSEIAKCVGKNRTSIANSIRLLKLPNPVIELLKEDKISAGHARAILSVDTSLQCKFATFIVDEGISVREAEIAAKGFTDTEDPVTSPSSKTARKKTTVALDLESRLRRALGTKVSVNINDKGRGELRISFFSPEELDSLLERMNA